MIAQNAQLNTMECVRGEVELKSFPTDVTLCLTNVCQQRCRFCNYNHEAVTPTYLPLETIQKMDWLAHVRHVLITGNGEALMHPDYVKILETVRRLAPETFLEVYTNGLALDGKRLEATVRYADKVHISQNAVKQKSYESIIYKGNYTRAMNNLKNLAAMKPKKMEVRLSFVAVNENVGDTKSFIDLASAYKFTAVVFLLPFEPTRLYDYSLGRESYENVLDKIDLEEMKRYACEKGVLFEHGSLGCRNIKLCYQPSTNLFLFFAEDGNLHVRCCCNGQPNIVIRPDMAHDIRRLWNNSRFQFLRSTVNNAETMMANKMCSFCRVSNTHLSKEEVFEQQSRMRIKRNSEDLRPQFFPLMRIDEEGEHLER